MMSPKDRQNFLNSFSEDELTLLYSTWEFHARPNQLPPEGDWSIWLIMAGRGFGKSRTLTEWACKMAEEMPGSSGAIIAATAADARNVLVAPGQPSSICSISPPWSRPKYAPTKAQVLWKNGTIGYMYSADEPNRLRGPQFHWAICDEFAAWRYPEAFDMLMMGLRLGDLPRCVIGTTPKPLPHVIQLWKQAQDLEDGSVVLSKGTTHENRANLAVSFYKFVVGRYAGTSLGRQELEAEILQDAKNSLWKSWMFNMMGFRITNPTHVPTMRRIVVAIDPAAKARKEGDLVTKDEEDYAETGIIVAGIAENGHGYILADLSASVGPNEWANIAIAAYRSYAADRIIAERNNGGDMVENTIRMTPDGPNISYADVTATRGKEMRAEPVVALYEQGRVHHVGFFGEVESQMTQWTPGQKSPDRLDALVWALTELMVDNEDDTIPFVQGRVRYRT